MNSRVAISLGLSILMHGLVFWVLIVATPGTEPALKQQAKSRVFTVNLLKPQVEDKSDHALALEDEAESRPHQAPEEDSSVAGGAGTVAGSYIDVASLTMPEPKYYTLAELDKAPVVVQDIDTNPPELLEYPQGGQLTVRLWIDEEGRVTKTELVTSELPPQFASSALKRFLDAKFSPGLKAGVAVRSVAKITVRYALVTPSGDQVFLTGKH